MGALMILVSFSLLLALGFFTAFVWAVRSGQFDDPVTPAFRFLADDDEVDSTTHKTNLEKNKNE